MPAADVVVSAVYVEDAVTPEILYYSNISDIDSETTMGANRGVWASTPYSSTGGPKAYDRFLAVYSVPNTSGQWSIYNSSYYNKESEGIDKWGRHYVKYKVTSSKGRKDQYITFTLTDGTTVQQNFAIHNV